MIVSALGLSESETSVMTMTQCEESWCPGLSVLSISLVTLGHHHSACAVVRADTLTLVVSTDISYNNVMDSDRGWNGLLTYEF